MSGGGEVGGCRGREVGGCRQGGSGKVPVERRSKSLAATVGVEEGWHV